MSSFAERLADGSGHLEITIGLKANANGTVTPTMRLVSVRAQPPEIGMFIGAVEALCKRMRDGVLDQMQTEAQRQSYLLGVMSGREQGEEMDIDVKSLSVDAT